jgi:hypothetical protein
VSPKPIQEFLPTPYRDVNAALMLLLRGVKSILGDEVVGIYLHGSLASGDFNPTSSDVDFVVATAIELPPEWLPELAEMHARIFASELKWATRLEGSYISLPALRRYDPDHALHPALRVDGSFGLDFHASDWIIQSYTLREQGIPLAGPLPRVFIDPILPVDLRRASRDILREWWEPMLSNPFRLQSREYQAYAVLTMCRILHTLQRGRVISKPAAARWAIHTLDSHWMDLVQQGLAWPAGPQPDRFNDTVDLVQFTLDRCREFDIE